MAAGGLGNAELMSRVTAGMGVQDAAGVDIGTVDAVQPPDTAGHGVADATPAGMIHRAVGAVAEPEPDVAPPRAATLSQAGYLTVDARRVLGRFVYAPAGQIADVAGEVVTLTVTAVALPAAR